MAFFAELRRRNVVKVAVAYAIVGWLLIEIAATIFPIVQLPAWTVTLVTMLLLLGFPIALVLSWAFELTPQGIERTDAVPAAQSITGVTGQKLNIVITALLVLAVGFMLVDNYILGTAGPFAGSEIDPTASSPEPEPTPPAGGEGRRDILPNSVAVLPFENLSPDPDNAFFAAGIHESIISQLARLRDLNVIARTSVMQYQGARRPISEIANELRVEAVMEGSVRYAGDRVLVTAQLIDGNTESHLWVDEYEGSLGDVFGIQADISMNIANALEAEFSPTEQENLEKLPTDSPAAYALYLRSLSSPDTGASDIDRAISLDPEFALAHATKAYWYAELLEGAFTSLTEAAELIPVVRDSAERALDLDSSLGIAHAALANIYNVESDFAAAQAAYEQALALSPNDSHVLALYSRFKRYTGDYDGAIDLSERSVDLGPSDMFPNLQLAFNYWYAHDYEAAVAAFQRCLEIDATFEAAHAGLAFVAASIGNFEEAAVAIRVAEQLEAGNRSSSLRLGQFAFAYGQMGRDDEAARYFSRLQALSRQDQPGEAVWAMTFLAIGDYEEAYLRLENAVANPQAGEQIALSELKANPYGNLLLDEPRWRELRDRIGVL